MNLIYNLNFIYFSVKAIQTDEETELIIVFDNILPTGDHV